MKNLKTTKTNKDNLLSTTELLVSSENFSKNLNNYKQFPDDISYYKNLVFEMNNEIGNINNKLSQIDISLSMSKQNSLSSQRNIINNVNTIKQQPQFDNKNSLPNQLKLNYTLSMKEEDKKINQLEKDRQELMMKNQELEHQLAKLEQFTKGTEDNNNIKNIMIPGLLQKQNTEQDIDEDNNKITYSNIYTNSNPNFIPIYGDNSNNSRNNYGKYKKILMEDVSNKIKSKKIGKLNLKNLCNINNKRSVSQNNSYVDNLKRNTSVKTKKQKRTISFKHLKEYEPSPRDIKLKQKGKRKINLKQKQVNNHILPIKSGKEEYKVLLMKLKEMFEPNNYEFLNVVAEIEDSVNNYIQALENQEKSVVEKYKKQLNNLEKENKELKNKIKKIMEITKN